MVCRARAARCHVPLGCSRRAHNERHPVQTPWLQHYPPGVPAQANIDAYRSLADLLEAAFQRHPSRDALACMDSR